VSIVLALLPVLLFLVGLSLMDSFKLVHRRDVLRSLLGGAVAALVAGAVLDSRRFQQLPVPLLVGYAGPIVEECAKAALVAWLVWTRRVGFLVDAALLGFAVGAGFALIENAVYLRELGDVPLALWLVRGLGTAVMHGGTTAVFAMLGRQLIDRFPRRGWLMFMPGLLVAIVVHGTFNRLLLPPLAQTALIVAVLPVLMLVVFERSERVTREWVGAGLDLDVELLQLVTSEHFEATRFASYLRSLRERFPGPIVADMFCLLRLELELSVQAKALVLARNAGVQLPADQDLETALGEYAFLKRSIGPTGLLALRPVQVASDRDAWHNHLLTQSRRVRAKRPPPPPASARQA
jgi:RsiW-degrading membrane proteinase PrsW (M82 family)